MEEVLISCANYGFPMVISIYLLVRFENKIDSLENSINLLTTAIKINLKEDK